MTLNVNILRQLWPLLYHFVIRPVSNHMLQQENYDQTFNIMISVYHKWLLFKQILDLKQSMHVKS